MDKDMDIDIDRNTNINANININMNMNMNRRRVFSNSARALFSGLATPFLMNARDPANALLLRFPVNDPSTQPLKNTYHFLRAGVSELEAEGIYSTNPLFLTNRDNALSPKGYDCLKSAAEVLKKTSLQPTVVYHSLAANGMDTGDYLAREFRLGRDRLLPEFTYLDQRGIGLWDSSDEAVVRPAVWAMDEAEAGIEGFEGRPPPNTDGTPNDTLHDQFTRLRQFLSLQESRTSGETILVIFPDGTGPALLSCMIAGIPFNDVHALEFRSGELRLNISPESVRALYDVKKNDPAYLATIKDGREKLSQLRATKDNDFYISFKDNQANEQQEVDNQVYYQQQKEAAAAKLKAEEEQRAAMQEQLRLSKERAEQKEEQRRLDALATREQKQRAIRERKEQAEKRILDRKRALEEKAEAVAAARNRGSSEVAGVAAATTSSPAVFGLSPMVLGAVGVGVLGATAALLGGNNDQEEEKEESGAILAKPINNGGDSDSDSDSNSGATSVADESAAKSTSTSTSASASTVVDLSAIPAAEIDQYDDDAPQEQHTVIPASVQETNNNERTTTTTASTSISVEDDEQGKESDETDIGKDNDIDVDINIDAAKEELEETNLRDPEEEFDTKLRAAEQEMKEALVEAAGVKDKKQQQQQQQQKATSSLFANDPPVTITTSKATKTTNYVYDDDEEDSDWLRVLSEIRDEIEEDEEDVYGSGMVDYANLVNNDETD